MAVNLAGPGQQETMNFFTREGGTFLINLSCMAYCLPVSEYVRDRCLLMFEQAPQYQVE